MTRQTSVIGAAVSRIDGRAKTTGAAKYAADQTPSRPPLHAVLVKSSVAAGRIVDFDCAAAAAMPGFVRFLSHLDGPLITPIATPEDGSFVPGEELTPFTNNRIHFAGQHIGVVLAATLEVAEAAAAAVTVHYDTADAAVDPIGADVTVERPHLHVTGEELQIQRGDPASAAASADHVLERTYTTPAEHHNPLEPSAVVAEWDGDQLILYDATQGNVNERNYVAFAMDVEPARVRVINPFIGGGFGCKGFAWPHVLIAAAAARITGLPVSLVLSRKDMYTSCGHRAQTHQRLTLAADSDGRLTALTHVIRTYRSPVGTFVEPSGIGSTLLYDVPHVAVTHEAAVLNRPSCTAMRGPGEATGSFAMESALDELAELVGVDPIEIRRRNHADTDPRNGRGWSSKHLLRCYDEGAAAFGWSDRSARPGARREGNEVVGLGMATSYYPANRMPTEARLTLRPGAVVVETAVQDIGTGAYTIIAQMVADRVGVPVGCVEVRIGDSDLPSGPLAGGSTTTASVAGAIEAVVAQLATQLGTPQEGERTATLMERFERIGRPELSVEGGSDVFFGLAGRDETTLSFYSFGAIFVEARVDIDYGIVRLPRIMGVFDAGRVLNPKTARSQMLGGMTFGIGMALLEQTEFGSDGRIVNPSLGEYYVPVNADVHDLEVRFVDEPDLAFNPFGARGIGELGAVGVPAAIANAVYNATGVRPRDLPITLDKVMYGGVTR